MAEIPVERKTAFPFWIVPAALIVLLALGAIAYTMSRPEEEAVNTVNVTEVDRVDTQSTVVDPPTRTTEVVIEDPVTTTTTTTTTQSQTPAQAPAQIKTSPQTNARTTTQATSQIQTDAQGVTRATSQINTQVKTPPETVKTKIVDVNVFARTPKKLSLVGREVLLKDVPVARVLSDRVFTVISGNTEFFAMLDKQLDSAGGNEARVAIKPNERRSFIGRFTKVPSADLRQEQNSDLPMDSQEYRELKNQQVYLHITNLTN
jgi:hypothetical protein